jgi:CheY-like chemotaxis protein
VSTTEALDSGFRRNDDIRSKLQGIEPSEIKRRTAMKDTRPLVLLVGDNPDHKELIVRSMDKIEKNIDHLFDGETALDYLFRRGQYANLSGSPLPELIILDLHIPKLDGLKVLKAIKGSVQLQHIPVVIFSSSESEKDIQIAYLYGANSYMVKSDDCDDFLGQISCIEAYWLCENRAGKRYYGH